MAQSVKQKQTKQKQNSIAVLSQEKRDALAVLASSGCRLGFSKKDLGFEPTVAQKIQIRVDKKKRPTDVNTVYLVPCQSVPIYVAHGASRYSAFDLSDKSGSVYRFYIFDIEGELVGDSQKFNLEDYQKLCRKR